MSDLIELEDVGRVYDGPPPVTALEHVSLRVRPGEHLAIMGPSGSGKSTLLNLLGLLDTPTSGFLRFDGEETTTASGRVRARLRADRIGFVFQAFELIGARTATENVELGLRYRRCPRPQRQREALDLLERVGLGHRAAAPARLLSGGERQRVAIARALAGEPDLLLCDEPTGNLDSATSSDVLDLLADQHRHGRTIVVITHDSAIAARAGRTILFRDGRAHEEIMASSSPA